MNNDFAKSILDGYFAQVWPPSRFLCHRGFQRFTILMRSDAALRKFQTTWRGINRTELQPFSERGSCSKSFRELLQGTARRANSSG